ncbi:hypothetical protein IJ750_01510 [bacterium]|nr:hypothetical protein [bacterium]
MQRANVVIVGEGKSIELIQNSKYLNKLYLTSNLKIKGGLNIKFNTFRELAQKCKALQADIVIVEDEKWIQQGIADVLKQNFINCIASNAKWSELSIHNLYTRNLLEKYDINTPQKLVLPIDFPVIVRADGIIKKANSVQEIIDIRKKIFEQSPVIGKTIFLEKFIDGEKYVVPSLFDGKSLLTFPNVNIEQELLNTYTKNLENLLRSEKAEFIGFINSKLILSDNKLYNTGFSFEFLKPDFDVDFLYILNSAIYQKLDEINL